MTATREVREARRTPEAAPSRTPVFAPRADVRETDDAFWLRIDVPGARPDDVNLWCENGQLHLRAGCAPRHAGKRALWWEYDVGDYARSFALGEHLDGDRIEAHLADGVLTVRLPKAESAKPKRITVRGG
jgi:HSP20 family protein